jgi:peroxiredoxin
MRLLLCSFIIALFHPINIYAQKHKLQSFTIEGSINADTGSIRLSYISAGGYYPSNIHEMTSIIKNGKFKFSGYLPYPHGFKLEYSQRKYISASFIVEPGHQVIICNIDSNKKTPIVKNISMKEYVESYRDAYKQSSIVSKRLDSKWDSLNKQFNNKIPDSIKAGLVKELKETYVEHDKILLRYVSAHPGSYLALWKLIELFDFGYEDIFPIIYSKFSPSIKSTFASIALSKKINEANSLIAIGKQFPLINSVNEHNNKLTKKDYSKNKFTLVDFWYSNCGPCNAQFDDMKIIYDEYKDKEFEIIGISTDRIKAKQNWLSVIDKRKLNWLQYWDKDGIESKRLSIIAFPTNFVLDQNGRVIKKNLQPVELKKFLEANLN